MSYQAQKYTKLGYLGGGTQKYTKLRYLGDGTFSDVYKVLGDDRREYAMKVVDFKYHAQYIIIELRALSYLRHPNIIKLEDHTVGEKFEFILELMARDINKKKFPGACMKKLILQLVNGLDYMHARGVIHGDIKPRNILYKYVGGEMTLVYTDFNSCVVKPSSHECRSEHYTLWWRSPEVMLRMGFGQEADVWALGCVIYEMYRGHPLAHEDGEINQIKKVFKILGNPLPVWPEIVNSTSWKILKDDASSLPEEGIFHATSGPSYMALLREMLKINPKHRISASNLLRHSFLQDVKMFDNSQDISQDVKTTDNPVSQDVKMSDNSQEDSILEDTDDLTLRYLEEREIKKCVKISITQPRRSILFEWTCAVMKEYRMSRPVLFLAFELFDQVGFLYEDGTKNIQMTMVSCLFIADHAISEDAAEAQDLVYISDNSFTEARLYEQIYEVLKIVGNMLHMSTAYERLINKLPKVLDDRAVNIASFFLFLIYMNNQRYENEDMALASIAMMERYYGEISPSIGNIIESTVKVALEWKYDPEDDACQIFTGLKWEEVKKRLR